MQDVVNYDLEAYNSLTKRDGKIFATSQVVAEKFGKEHYSVLRSIRSIECSSIFKAYNFVCIEVLDDKGASQPMFNLTRDGFVRLVMGFTGSAAAKWKEAYINAFNKMEEELLKRVESITPLYYTPMQKASLDFKAFLDIGQMLQLPTHITAIEATKQIRNDSGIDLQLLLEQSPIMDCINPDQEYLEVTELGQRYELSGQRVNQLIEQLGFQQREPEGWVAINAGIANSSRHAWKKGNKSGYNLKWKVSFIDLELAKFYSK